MSFDAGAITGTITLDRSPMTKALKGAKSELQGFSAQTQSFGSSIKKAFVPVAAILGGAGLVMGVKRLTGAISDAMGAIDQTAKTASKLGVTTEALTGLHHAAELSGVSANTMDMAMQRMTRRVAEAAQGSGEAKDALAELGLNAQQLASMSPDQQFLQIADAMQGVGSHSDKVRMAFKVFDSEGVGLINTMKGGADAIRASMQENEKLGKSLSALDVSAVQQANDALKKVGDVIQGWVIKAAVALSPYITAIANLFVDAATAGDGFGKHVVTAVEWAATGIAHVLSIIDLVKAGFYGLQAAATFAIGGIVKGIGWLKQQANSIYQQIWDMMQPFINLGDYIAPGAADAIRQIGQAAINIDKQVADAASNMGSDMLAEAGKLAKKSAQSYDDFASGRMARNVTQFFDDAKAKAQSVAEESTAVGDAIGQVAAAAAGSDIRQATLENSKNQTDDAFGEKKLAGLVFAGSAEAQAMQHRGGKTTDYPKKQLDEQAESNDHLSEIARLMRDQDTPQIVTIPGL